MMNNSSFTSPTVRKLNSFVNGYYEGDRATYGGVMAKTLYFMALIGMGLAAYFVLHAYLAQNGAAANQIAEGFVVYQTELVALVGCVLFIIVTSIVNIFAPSIIPVTGSIYAACTGYWITFVSRTYAYQYGGIVIEALALTVLLVAVLAVLYGKGIVHVGEKMRTIIYSLFAVSFFGGLIFFVMYMLAPTSAVVQSIITIQNGPLGIVFAVIGVAIACLFLLCDFDTISQTVESGLAKKYEWFAAYGLVVGVVYLYLKILQLLARMQKK